MIHLEEYFLSLDLHIKEIKMYVHNQGRAELESLALAEAQTCPGGPRLHPPTHPPPTTTGVPRVLGQFRGFSEAS